MYLFTSDYEATMSIEAKFFGSKVHFYFIPSAFYFGYWVPMISFEMTEVVFLRMQFPSLEFKGIILVFLAYLLNKRESNLDLCACLRQLHSPA